MAVLRLRRRGRSLIQEELSERDPAVLEDRSAPSNVVRLVTIAVIEAHEDTKGVLIASQPTVQAIRFVVAALIA
jgi:hypothetical protein